MKKINFKIGMIALTLILGIFTWQSCQNDFDNNFNFKTDEIANVIKKEGYFCLDSKIEFQDVGLLHNEGLDTLFEYLKKETRLPKLSRVANIDGKNSKEDLEAIINKGTNYFCQNNDKLNTKYSNFMKSFDKQDNNIRKVKANEETEVSLTPNVEKFIKDINLVIKKHYKKCKVGHQNTKELIKVKNELEELNLKATNTLSTDEATVVKISTNVAFASLQYWLKNLEKWAAEFGEKSTPSKISSPVMCRSKSKSEESWWDKLQDWWNENGEDVVKHDCIGGALGATAGAIEGAMGGSIAGPEGTVLGGVGGAVVEGTKHAIWDSTVEIIGKLID